MVRRRLSAIILFLLPPSNRNFLGATMISTAETLEPNQHKWFLNCTFPRKKKETQKNFADFHCSIPPRIRERRRKKTLFRSNRSFDLSLSLSSSIFFLSLSPNCYFPNFLFSPPSEMQFPNSFFFSFRPRRGILRRFLREKPSKGGGGIGEMKGRRVGEIPWF